MQGCSFAGLGQCLTFNQAYEHIMDTIHNNTGKFIVDTDDQTADIENDKAEEQDEFTTYMAAQYYDDSISLRTINDQILYLQTFEQEAYKFGMYLNKKKSKITIKSLNELTHEQREYITSNLIVIFDFFLLRYIPNLCASCSKVRR